ncbi:hypothetical protein V5G20_18050 [Brevibacillus borstelensis]|uniref:hypothetical protein n=1 Tax=Brevibacillus borstelensis TaxID=45462 RepID=UPI0030CAE567
MTKRKSTAELIAKLNARIAELEDHNARMKTALECNGAILKQVGEKMGELESEVERLRRAANEALRERAIYASSVMNMFRKERYVIWTDIDGNEIHEASNDGGKTWGRVIADAKESTD